MGNKNYYQMEKKKNLQYVNKINRQFLMKNAIV